MDKYVESINFGTIYHFLYVRIMHLCADLGLTTKEFIEEGCDLFIDIVDPNGMSRFDAVEKEFRRYLKESEEKKRLIPRMSQKHAFVVKGVKDEIAEYLNCIRTDKSNNNNFKWNELLCILLMLVEIYRNRIDEQEFNEWAEKNERQHIIKEIEDFRVEMGGNGQSEDDEPDNSYKMEAGYRIHKPKKLREYERNR